MASLVRDTRQACRLCRRRKVKVSNADLGCLPGKCQPLSLTWIRKCDGLPTCSNCHGAKTPCQYSPPKKRGPKPVRWHDNCPSQPLDPTSPAMYSPGEPERADLVPAGRAYSYPTSDSPLSSNSITANPVSAPPESQTQTAVKVHLDLLAGLLLAAPSDTAASIANRCILLYTQYVFGTVPMCHEATLRVIVSRFFISSSSGDDPSDNRARISRCFAADNEGERIGVLRSYTVLAALCAAVTYVLPEALLPNKHLIAPLFLRAARETLRIYEDYDLEHPNSSSLSIRLFLSSAIQIATGTQGVAFHVLSEAGLIAMRMGLYNESSLEGREPVEENILRNAFWQLYVCDKTALVMKGRPVTIHESLFETELTLKTHSRSSVPLFEVGRASGGARIEDHLVDGFHVIRRLWAMAARVIQGMESNSRRTWDAHADTQGCRESIAQLSEVYFEMITLTNNLPAWAQSPGESSPDVNREVDRHLFDILQRQRTSYLITLQSIKVFVLNSAIQCNMTEVIGLSAEPLTLAMKQIELAQDFLNVLESVPFLHLQAEGEHCVSRKESLCRSSPAYTGLWE